MMMMLTCPSTTWIQMRTPMKKTRVKTSPGTTTGGREPRGRCPGRPGRPAPAARPAPAPALGQGQGPGHHQDHRVDQSQAVDENQEVVVLGPTVTATDTLGLGPGLVTGAQREEVTLVQDLGQALATDHDLATSGLGDRLVHK